MSAVPAPALPRIEFETPTDAAAVEALVLAAFGPGRFAKTAERLRERAGLAVGFVCREGAEIVGTVRLWSIRIGETPALFLGPIAVEGGSRRGGLGAALTEACLDWARGAGASGVLLVGDPGYFDRFGFATAPGVAMPGPVDPRRVMWLGLSADEAPRGAVRAER